MSSLEQFDGTRLYTFDLSNRLRYGQSLEPASLATPPPLAIETPPGNDPMQPATRLTISLGSADFRDIRLYHNGVPIPSGLEESIGPVSGSC